MLDRNTLAGLGTAAVIALALTACSDDSKPTSGGSGDDGELSVQFVNPLPNYPAWRTIGDCMKEQAEERGVDFTESGPSGTLNPTAMIQQVQQAISASKGAIITFPASDGFAPVLQQAQDAGIITETLYGSGAGGDTGADINVAVNWATLGEKYVAAIADRPGQQVLGLVAASDTGVGKSWIDGVKAAAEETDNVEVVGEVYTNDDAAKALPQTTALLTAHPEINVVATHMGTATPGVISAIDSKGLTEDVAFLANGPDNGGKEGLADGSVYRLLVQDLCGEGKTALDAVVDADAGTMPPDPSLVEVGAEMVSDEDLQSYLDKGWG